MGILTLLFIAMAICTGFGDVLNQIWINTLDTGITELYSAPANISKIHTKLSDYQLNPAPSRFLRFQVKACNDAFILLSAAYALNSTFFYEIVIGGTYNTKTIFRVGFLTMIELNKNGSLSCNDFNNFMISWSYKNLVLEKTLPVYEVMFNWTDPSPILVNGIGIRTGYGSNGTWIIEHQATLTGYNCGRPDTYGNMLILQSTEVRSVIECNSLCASNDQCLGVNFKAVTNECQLIAGGQVVKKLVVGGWFLYTKCLNKASVCLGCLK